MGWCLQFGKVWDGCMTILGGMLRFKRAWEDVCTVSLGARRIAGSLYNTMERKFECLQKSLSSTFKLVRLVCLIASLKYEKTDISPFRNSAQLPASASRPPFSPCRSASTHLDQVHSQQSPVGNTCLLHLLVECPPSATSSKLRIPSGS